jgi:beta-N-acetylhexosaminidase
VTNIQIGQLFFIGIAGTSLTAEEKRFIVDNNISGITLFGRNVKEPNQVFELCKEIQALSQQMPDKAPLYIAIDMEGGRVARLKDPFTQWPPLKRLGDLDSPSLSFDFASAMGQELRAVGINVNWAPCLDVFTNPKNTVIGDRAISADPEIVAKHASALIRGYLKADVIPCAKHFPGHGNTLVDSHNELPIEETTYESLNQLELIPFKKAIKSKATMLMTSHILFKNIDSEWPVTLSQKFLKSLLRDILQYKGLVVTDDLGMKALAKYHDVKKIPVRALEAGADLLLYCNEPDSPPQAIEAIKEAIANKTLAADKIEGIYTRVLEHKKDHLLNPYPLTKEAALALIGCEAHQTLAHKLAHG